MKPKVQAILLADHVYKDEFTGKYIVSGIIDGCLFRPNPPEPKPGDIPLDMHRAGAPYVYVNLTEFNGRFDFEIRYLSLTQLVRQSDICYNRAVFPLMPFPNETAHVC